MNADDESLSQTENKQTPSGEQKEGEDTPEPQAEGCLTTLAGLILTILLIVAVFGLSSYCGRTSDPQEIPVVEFLDSTRRIDNIPSFTGDVTIRIKYVKQPDFKAGIVEIVDDDTYTKEKGSLERRLFAGSWFGGTLYDVPVDDGKASLTIARAKLKGDGNKKYWIRPGVLLDSDPYTGKGAARILDSFGRAIDNMSNYSFRDLTLPDGRSVREKYFMGVFQPFWVVCSP